MTTSLNTIYSPVLGDAKALGQALASHIQSTVPLIVEVAQYVVENGGKRLRPILTLLAHAACGDSKPQSAMLAACAIEYIHTASLLHDDVIDNAALRRGKPSANARWGARLSVLVGDFFYCRASELLVELGDLHVLDLVSRAIEKTTEGEVLEIATQYNPDLSESQCLSMIYNKTAALMGAACESGAHLASGESAALRSYGEHLGMAFQIADDVLDYMSTDEKFGKVNGTDFKEGHLTLPMLYSLMRASDSERRRFASAYAQGVEDPSRDRSADMAFAEQLIVTYDGVSLALQKAKEYVQKAKASLEPLSPGAAKTALIELADYVIARTH